MYHDDVLSQHEQKMEQHRRWMREQQQALASYGVPTTAAAAPSSSSAVPPPSSSLYATLSPQQAAAYHQPHQQVHHNSYGNGGRVPLMTSALVTTPTTTTAAAPTTTSPMLSGRSPQPVAVKNGSSSSVQRSTPRPTSSSSRSQPRPTNADSSSGDFVTTGTGSPLAVYMRSTQWTKRREQRLEEQRKQQEDLELHECSFTPSCAAPLSSYESPSRHSDAGSGWRHSSLGANSETVAAPPATGTDSFIKRLEKARQERREKEQRLHWQGGSWSPQPTVAEPFQLGQRVPTGTIRALRQPIQPPHRTLDASAASPYLFLQAAREGEAHIREEEQKETAESRGLPPPGSFSTKHMLRQLEGSR